MSGYIDVKSNQAGRTDCFEGQEDRFVVKVRIVVAVLASALAWFGH